MNLKILKSLAWSAARERNLRAHEPLGKLCACSRPAVVKRNGHFICAWCRGIESRFRLT